MDNSSGIELPYRPFVYIAESEDRSIIKIGSTVSPGSRVKLLRFQAREHLQRDERFRLISVWVEEDMEESEIQKLFADLSMGHEFFRWDTRIVEYAKSQQHRFAPAGVWNSWSPTVSYRMMGWPVNHQVTTVKKEAPEKLAYDWKREVARITGALGGAAGKGMKGFAKMTPARRKEISALAVAARRRKKENAD